MPRNKVEEETQVHKHRWIKNTNKLPFCDQMYRGRPCKAIRVTTQELENLTHEWDNFFEIVKSTEVYADRQAMKVAYSSKNKPEIKAIMARVESRNHWVENRFGDRVLEPNNPLPQPEYPDPVHNKSVYIVWGQS